MLDYQEWIKYAIYNDDGVCGIKEDAPESAKKQYKEYLKEQEEAEKDGIII